MADPAVSVVVTCYNYGKYLRGCLNSVLRQTFSDLEIIVVNDGSTDDTDQVMEQFTGLPNVKYVRQENAGQANAKNTGIRNSSGRLIAFLDADDAWEEDKLEKQMPLFANDAVGAVFSLARYVGEDGESVDVGPGGPYLSPRAGNVTEFLFMDNFIPFSSSVVRSDCLKRLGVFNESLKMGIDWDLWLRISTGYEFDFVDEPLLIYRVGHAGQMSKNLEERQRCSDEIMSEFLRRNPGKICGSTLRKAYAYTCCNRGEYFREIDPPRSTKYFLKALCRRPLATDAYKGLIKNLLRRTGNRPRPPLKTRAPI